MALTDIALCSRALLMIGATSIASFDEGTAEAEVAANLYPSVRDALIASHPWNFALRQGWLAQLVDVPTVDFSHAYQIPVDCLRVISAGVNARGRGLPFRVIGRALHCDSDEVALTYVARVDETLFPAFVDQAVISRLAAEFCLPLTESTSRAQFLYKLAEDELRRARLADAQEDTAPTFQDFTLVEVRS